MQRRTSKPHGSFRRSATSPANSLSALSYTRVTHPGAQPQRSAFIIHGILGSKRNWISFARRFCALRPDFEAVCIDLRHHGESPKPPGPHTVAKCAQDISALRAVVGVEPEVILGHSFGGKVVMHYARDMADELEHLFIVDTPPGKTKNKLGSDEIKTVLDAVDSAPLPFPDRDAVVAHFERAGLQTGIGRWMTTNVVREGAGLVFRFSITAVRELLVDYGGLDYWPVLETPPTGVTAHMIRGERSSRFDDTDIARFASLQGPACTVDVVAGAGHWVHTDAPEALLDIVVGRMTP